MIKIVRNILRLFNSSPINEEKTEEKNIPNTETFFKKLDFKINNCIHADQCNDVIVKVIDHFQNTINSFRKPLETWAKTDLIKISIMLADKANANYNRQEIKLFYDHEITAKECQEMLAHELGHALLDSLRPDLWNTQAIEAWSFHESFADIVTVVYKINNNIDNFSVIGSSFGGHKRNLDQHIDYENPYNLPNRGEGMTSELHDFSLVFSSAWFEIVKKLQSQNGDWRDSANIAFKCLLRAIAICPKVHLFGSALVKSMMYANPDHMEMFKSVFEARGMVRPEIKMMGSKVTFEDIKKNINPYGILKSNKSYFIYLEKKQTWTTVEECLSHKMSASPEEMYYCAFLMPDDILYVFDKSGEFVEYISNRDGDPCVNSINSLRFIKENDMLNDTWSIFFNSIVRVQV